MLHVIQNFTSLCKCLKKEPIYKDLRIYANFDKGLEKGSGYSFPDPTYLFLNNVSNLSSFRFFFLLTEGYYFFIFFYFVFAPESIGSDSHLTMKAQEYKMMSQGIVFPRIIAVPRLIASLK